MTKRLMPMKTKNKITTPRDGVASSVVAPIKRTFSSSAIAAMMPITPIVLTLMGYQKEIGSVRTVSILQMWILRGISLRRLGGLERQRCQEAGGRDDLRDEGSYSNNSGIEPGKGCVIGLGIS